MRFLFGNRKNVPCWVCFFTLSTHGGSERHRVRKEEKKVEEKERQSEGGHHRERERLSFGKRGTFCGIPH